MTFCIALFFFPMSPLFFFMNLIHVSHRLLLTHQFIYPCQWTQTHVFPKHWIKHALRNPSSSLTILYFNGLNSRGSEKTPVWNLSLLLHCWRYTLEESFLQVKVIQSLIFWSLQSGPWISKMKVIPNSEMAIRNGVVSWAISLATDFSSLIFIFLGISGKKQ